MESVGQRSRYGIASPAPPRFRAVAFAAALAALLAAAPAAVASAPAHATHGGKRLGATPLLGPHSTAVPVNTYTVNTFADPAPPSTPPYCPDTNGDCSLREAIMQANADGTLDAIAVPAGHYLLTQPATGGDDASSGDLNITDPGGVEIDGAGPSSTIVDASGLGDRVLTVGSGGATTTVPVLIQSLTIANGTTTANGGGVYVASDGALTLSLDTVSGNTSTATGTTVGGGGVYNAGSLWLQQSTVTQNHASTDGGGVYDYNLMNVNGTTFSSNDAVGEGGGLFVYYPATVTKSTFSSNSAKDGGGIANDDNLLLDHVTLTGNQADAASGYGGAVYENSSYPLVVRSSRLAGNGAYEGGGLYNDDGNVRLEQSVVTHNTALYGGGVYDYDDLQAIGGSIDHNTATYDGGGLYASYYTIITNVKLNANSAGGSGGGAYVESSYELGIDRSTVTNNQAASDGGGIYNGGALRVNDSTFSRDSSGGYGGALYNASEGQLTNDTLTGNSSASDGGAVYTGAGLDITEATIDHNATSTAGGGGGIATTGITPVTASIVALNTAAGSPSNCSLEAGVTSITAGFNLESGTDCNFTATGDQQSVNPKLGTLGVHGGPTPTQPLKPGSPAINAAGTTCATATDQRGKHRPARGACDIGAFEAQ